MLRHAVNSAKQSVDDEGKRRSHGVQNLPRRPKRNYWAYHNPDDFVPYEPQSSFPYSVECRLIRAAQEGDTSARNQIWERYSRMVLSVANDLYIPERLLADVIQEGLIGLAIAIGRFNVDKFDTFTTFAGHCVRRNMQRFLFANNFSVKLPSNWFYKYCQFRKALACCPTRQAENSCWDSLRAEDFKSYIRMISLHTLANCCTLELSDEALCIADSQGAGQIDERVQSLVRQAVNELPDRQREILRRSYGLDGVEPCPVKQLAIEFGLTRISIWRITQAAKAQLVDSLRNLFLEDESLCPTFGESHNTD